MWRCELCDCYLRILQTGYLCDTCYKIRLITKCYSADEILKCVEDKFKIKLSNLLDSETTKWEKPKSYKNITAGEIKTIVLRETIPLDNKRSVSSEDKTSLEKNETYSNITTRNKKK